MELDQATDEIVRDPALAQNPESEPVKALTAIYGPNAEGLNGALSAFRRDAEAGTHLEPLGTGMARTTTVTGQPVTVDENTVKVPVCFRMSHRKVDRDGNVLEHIDGLAQPGEVTAVRIDGAWRLQRLDIFGNTICTQQGGQA